MVRNELSKVVRERWFEQAESVLKNLLASRAAVSR